MLARVIVAAAVVALVGPAAAAQEATLFTLTNLHPDIKRSSLSTTNFQQDGLIPACTEVKQLERSGKKLVFEFKGTKYHYELQGNSTPEGFEANVVKYFGATCDAAAVKRMSSVDQQGIKEGRALVGMTKKGVLLAIGYPPGHRTKSTDDDQWTYWHNRFNTFIVYFTDGKVREIKD